MSVSKSRKSHGGVVCSVELTCAVSVPPGLFVSWKELLRCLHHQSEVSGTWVIYQWERGEGRRSSISHLCSVCWTKSLWDLRSWPPRPEMKYFRWEILRNTKPEINCWNPFPPSRKLPNSLNAKFGWKGMLKAGALKPPPCPCLSWAASSDLPSDLASAETCQIFPSDWTQFLVEIIQRCKHCNYWWWGGECWDKYKLSKIFHNSITPGLHMSL